MSRRLEFVPRVRLDWLRLRREVLDASGSEAVTAAYEARIRNACDSLVDFPNGYPPWRYSPSLRMMPIAKYCVFYRVVGDTVRVVHIRYAGRTPFRSR